MKFSIQHARDSEFHADGLRQYFEYRDLGIKDATDGRKPPVKSSCREDEGQGCSCPLL